MERHAVMQLSVASRAAHGSRLRENATLEAAFSGTFPLHLTTKR
jgi:hypothetical protein